MIDFIRYTCTLSKESICFSKQNIDSKYIPLLLPVVQVLYQYNRDLPLIFKCSLSFNFHSILLNN